MDHLDFLLDVQLSSGVFFVNGAPVKIMLKNKEATLNNTD